MGTRFRRSHSLRQPVIIPKNENNTHTREWALLLPSYSIVLVLLTYFTYLALAIAGTPAFSDMSTKTGASCHRLSNQPRKIRPQPFENATDSKALLPDADEPNPYLAYASPNAVPEMFDIPIGLVNRVLYAQREERNGVTRGLLACDRNDKAMNVR